MKGWVTLHRQIENNPLWLSEPFTKAQAWVDLILNANHKDGFFIVRGIRVDVKRGQLGWSEVTMSTRWRWSRNKVRRFLKYLERERQVEQQKIDKITTIITIINYSKYQDDTSKGQQTIQQTIHKQQCKQWNNNNSEANASAKVKSKKKDMSWNKQSDDYEEGYVDLDGDTSLIGEKKKPTRKYPNAPAVRKVFQEVLGKNPANWKVNATQLKSCENLFTERGLEKIRKALEFYQEHKEKEYCPQVPSPYDLDSKWTKLGEFKLKQP